MSEKDKQRLKNYRKNNHKAKKLVLIFFSLHSIKMEKKSLDFW